MANDYWRDLYTELVNAKSMYTGATPVQYRDCYTKGHFIDPNVFQTSTNYADTVSSCVDKNPSAGTYYIRFLMRPVSYTALTPRIYNGFEYNVYYPFDTTNYNIIDLVPKPSDAWSASPNRWIDGDNIVTGNLCDYRIEDNSYVNITQASVGSGRSWFGVNCQSEPYKGEASTSYEPANIGVNQFSSNPSEIYVTLRNNAAGKKIKFKMYYCITNLRLCNNNYSTDSSDFINANATLAVAEANDVMRVSSCATAVSNVNTAASFPIISDRRYYCPHQAIDAHSPNTIVCEFPGSLPPISGVSNLMPLENLPDNLYAVTGNYDTPVKEWFANRSLAHPTIYSNFRVGYAEGTYTTISNYQYLLVSAGIDELNSMRATGRTMAITKLVVGISFEDFHT